MSALQLENESPRTTQTTFWNVVVTTAAPFRGKQSQMKLETSTSSSNPSRAASPFPSSTSGARMQQNGSVNRRPCFMCGLTRPPPAPPIYISAPPRYQEIFRVGDLWRVEMPVEANMAAGTPLHPSQLRRPDVWLGQSFFVVLEAPQTGITEFK